VADPGLSVAIVGAGTMGWQLALTLAAHGAQIRLTDVSPAALEAGIGRLTATAAELERTGDLPGAADATSRVTSCPTLEDAVEPSWFVLEAIPERIELKRELFAQLSTLVGPDIVLATNSSSFTSRELAPVVSHPERLLNAHFYNSPWRRSAVELMTCGQTDPAVIERARSFFDAHGFSAFVVRGESTGFLFNRIWRAVKAESLRVVAEGLATPAEVDRIWEIVMESRPGPFARMDRVGLDVVLDIERHYAAESGDPRDEPPAFLAEKVARGELGRKSGRGFYEYEGDG
jgi:3-hydroxybutyryl-CoA dehydrogenase